MRRFALVTALALLISARSTSPALAQPSAAADPARVDLSPSEQRLLARGEISGDRHVAGVVVSVIPGLGLGHVVQQRWLERGWIFTLGEFAAFGLIAVSSSESDLNLDLTAAMAIAGWGGFLGLRVWEVTDAVRGPSIHNRRVREVKARKGRSATAERADVFVAPMLLGTRPGTIAGVTLRF